MNTLKGKFKLWLKEHYPDYEHKSVAHGDMVEIPILEKQPFDPDKAPPREVPYKIKRFPLDRLWGTNGVKVARVHVDEESKTIYYRFI